MQPLKESNPPLEQSALISVRIDSSLKVEGTPSGRAKRTGPGVLEFRRANKTTGRVTGSSARLDLLARLVGDAQVKDAGGLLLPKDGESFVASVTSRRAEVERLLAEGRDLVEEVERLVCGLYGLDKELTDEVVAHAVERAAAAGPV